MQVATLLAVVASLVPAAPLLAQSVCRLAPLDPSSGIHTGGLDLEGDWLAARVKGPSHVEWIETRRKFGPAWLPATAIPSPVSPGSDFGGSLDVDVSSFGVELMIAAPGAPTALGAGIVLRYLYHSGGWSPVPEFRSGDPDAQVFGTNLARAVDVAAVQSKRFLFASTESQVHLFEPLGAISWVETGRIDHPDPAGDRTHFGAALAIAPAQIGSSIVVSSLEQPVGRVWVWPYLSIGQVGLPAELLGSSPRSSEFGTQVAIWNGLIAVGDPGVEGIPGQPGSGAVTLFAPSVFGNVYIEVARFTAPTGRSVGFGRGLAFEDDRLAVTFDIPPVQPGGLTVAPALTIIEDPSAALPRFHTVASIPNDPDSAVGRGVALGSGEAVTTDVVIVVGNQLQTDPRLRRVSVMDPVLNVCPGAPNSTGQPARLSVDGCVSATSVALLGESLPPMTVGIPVLGTLRGSLPVGQGTLCIGDPRRLAVAGSDVQGVLRTTIDPLSFGFGVGEVVIAQLWYRDGMPGTNLSGAVAFELAP